MKRRKLPIVPGPKEARFPHLWHAGPTATTSSHQHHQCHYHHHHNHHVCHEYFRWAATASCIGDRLNIQFRVTNHPKIYQHNKKYSIYQKIKNKMITVRNPRSTTTTTTCSKKINIYIKYIYLYYIYLNINKFTDDSI